MRLRVALQMDPLDSINPRYDSTFFLGLEAHARGHELFYYLPQDVAWHEGKLLAKAHAVRLHDDATPHYTLGEPQRLELAGLDVILLRQDPPFDMGYYTNTLLLEQLPTRVQVVNNPAAIRNNPEKLIHKT